MSKGRFKQILLTNKVNAVPTKNLTLNGEVKTLYRFLPMGATAKLFWETRKV